jgi:hypothetical protein
VDIEGRLYYYGLGAGLPYRALNSIANVVDEARHAADIAQRRRHAKVMLAGSPWVGFMPRNTGYAILKPDTLPEAPAALEAARAIIEDRRKTGWKSRKSNPFFQCERPEDMVNYPALMNLALSDAVIHIVSDYYGMIPQLLEIGIWVTPQQTRQFSSQLYHLDKPESRLVKMFLNIEETSMDAGPLTFLPANVSEKVRAKTNYEKIYFRGDGRLPDEKVYAVAKQADEVMLGGVAGSGGVADTSNCFHFGSRCQSGERKMLTVAFMLPHKARKTRTPLFDLVPRPNDPVEQLVLAGAAFNY